MLDSLEFNTVTLTVLPDPAPSTVDKQFSAQFPGPSLL